MSTELIITLIALGCIIVGGILTIVVALIRGELKKFVVEKMEEAEASGKSGAEKLAYVLEEVKKKYKLADLFLNIKKFIEIIISISKNINAK